MLEEKAIKQSEQPRIPSFLAIDSELPQCGHVALPEGTDSDSEKRLRRSSEIIPSLPDEIPRKAAQDAQRRKSREELESLDLRKTTAFSWPHRSHTMTVIIYQRKKPGYASVPFAALEAVFLVFMIALIMDRSTSSPKGFSRKYSPERMDSGTRSTKPLM